MSESLKRVKEEAIKLALELDVIEIKMAKTALEAAREIGCEVEEIAKSIVMKSEANNYYLFICSGIHMVDIGKASSLTKQRLKIASPKEIREYTGFAIGGVSPIGHKKEVKKIFDCYLTTLKQIYAAAGTPNHVLRCDPRQLLERTNGIELDFIKES
tara:strand:+ start:171 stop:641 length:471 start_codon:yes stop_codon:yes gene_type:complete